MEMAANIFERLAQGRPQQPTPEPMPQATSPEVRKLLDWLQHDWDKPTLRTRDIIRHGPHCLNNKESALAAADILVRRGWLLPLKSPRRDVKVWQITIGPPEVDRNRARYSVRASCE
jgi:hypothetical protein